VGSYPKVGGFKSPPRNHEGHREKPCGLFHLRLRDLNLLVGRNHALSHVEGALLGLAPRNHFREGRIQLTKS